MKITELNLKNQHHESVVLFEDESADLTAIVAIHSSKLGPAMGGTRVNSYLLTETIPQSNTKEKAIDRALEDVLSLSEGMTYKNAAINSNYGGGKAVIIGNPNNIKSEELWRSYAQIVNYFKGKFITAEDSGSNEEDMLELVKTTKYVTGLPTGNGDPSPKTAYGVFLGMKAASLKIYGKQDLSNRRILVQGLGGVGKSLVKYLLKENAEVIAYDIDNKIVKEIKLEFPQIQIVSPYNPFIQNFDIFSPCAMGKIIDSELITKLNKCGCKIIAGAANNQLSIPTENAISLQKHKILYMPDFIINAGGLIDCISGYEGYNEQWVKNEIEKIPDRLNVIIEIAEKENLDLNTAAISFAQGIIDNRI